MDFQMKFINRHLTTLLSWPQLRLCIFILLLLPVVAVTLNVVASFFFLFNMLVGVFVGVGFLQRFTRKEIASKDQSVLKQSYRVNLSQDIVGESSFFLWRQEVRRRRKLKWFTLRWTQGYHHCYKERAFMAFRMGILLEERVNLYRTIRYHNEETELLRTFRSDSSSTCRSWGPDLVRVRDQQQQINTWVEMDGIPKMACPDRKWEEDLSVLPSTTMPPSAFLFTHTDNSLVSVDEKLAKDAVQSITETTSTSDVSEGQLARIKELEERSAWLDLELQCKETQLEVAKREASNLKRSLQRRRGNARNANVRDSGGEPASIDSAGCWETSAEEVRELEIEVKGLKARLLIQEQTLQDTHAGVEHAANILRMQCTTHIHKSAALHRAVALAVQQSVEEYERRMQEAVAREKGVKEQLEAREAQVAQLRAELSALRAGGEWGTDSAGHGEGMPVAAAATAGDGMRRDVEEGESAAELAAACSRRLREAWGENERLMEALETERKRCLSLQVLLEQRHGAGGVPVSTTSWL